MAVPKLTTSQISKVFRKGENEIEVLRDINLSINDGEFVSIVGASGCGKTTLLRILDGLIRATSGSVIVNDKEVTGPGPERAFVFQQDGLMPWRTVEANVWLGLEIRGALDEAARKLAHDHIRLVGLAGFEKYYPHELSGGMRQRVNIARALTVNPDILLMDEPFAALDAQTREIMQAEMMRIWQQAKKTVLLITHQIDEAVFLSDRVIVFTARPGRVKEEIVVDLPRPRELSVKRTPEFTQLTERIWNLIEQEVREGIRHEGLAALKARAG
ncbi:MULTISPECIES: ABC transporter ATP-binding protein [unclassified Beijerinckia]|uniref:ABC transporter ATP-binding protein n=1 Tax=unclassified Beijerinckia TaxID=2638183 RepID=UPI00089B8A4E|nr:MULTISPECIES: ABC transporter ATP-binding protein [unclassified Beijerinckia]MDH7794276.1 NitT/TauT family transport system ATP-binding protein [Beijerinckia sp. GAS462]SEB57555.1 NitT/TauT family transport system ATP-binding protein [Beijerinckia sp. 28-YEA-48]